MKCEHGEKITKFCISQHCNFSTSASCSYCLKKYHIHPGTLETLSSDQFQQLIAHLTTQKNKKFKQSSITQLLNAYFQALKQQITQSFDFVCKNMIERISHPFLYTENMLETYKKAKIKDFGKLSVQELRKLHEFYGKNSLNFEQKQNKIYKSEMKNVKETIESLDQVFQSYQQVIRLYDKNFTNDRFFSKKVVELTEKIMKESSSKYITEVKEVPIKIWITEKVQINPQHDPRKKKLKKLELDYPKIMSFEQYKNMKSVEFLKSKQNLNGKKLTIQNKPKQRKISIRLQSESSEENKEERRENIIPKKSFETTNPKAKLPCECQQNIKKNSEKIRLNFINPYQNQNNDTIISQHFECKLCESFELQSPKLPKKEILQNKHIEFIVGDSDHQNTQPFEHKEASQKKIVRVQTKGINFNKYESTESPLLKKRIQKKDKLMLKLQKMEQIESKEEKHPIPKDEINLSENELKSLALLIESIQLPSEKAIKYLRKSLYFCPQNLSAAEYLSYLLIEEDHPKQCLELCNLIIAKLFIHTHHIDDSFSIHILNNKAAALNILGRFSQSIQFLERILPQFNHPPLYKNLADAYCAIGIQEKSILNYQKCISMDEGFDEGFYNLAVCFYCQHNYREALDMVEKAIQINPEQQDYLELFINIKQKLD